MTKIQIHFRLQKPLDDSMMEGLNDVNSIYGIDQIKLAPSMEDLMVEYDATRLKRSEVEAALLRCGIPIIAAAAAPTPI